MEYNAERWAIRRAKESYGIVSDDYLQDAKNYVRNHLLENLTNTDLTIERVKPYVLDWLGETKETIAVALQEIN